ncbi:MAG: amidohydrolase family protein, partial [Anaerolineales bacterium]|nr:amidohydrolase family protein [Anaerolineales bacterium]
MAEMYDVIIKNADIVDGTGAPPFRGSIGIRGEKIVKIGLVQGQAPNTIDAQGLTACPGFIDPHSHADLTILDAPLAENLVMQGITTFIGGNCGLTIAPLSPDETKRDIVNSYTNLTGEIKADWNTFGEWLNKVKAAGACLNYVPLVGRNAIRGAVMGYDFMRIATPAEVDQMIELLREAMNSGAFGLSDHLDPSPAAYADFEETVAMAKLIREYDGFYVPHTRHSQSHWYTDDPKEFDYSVYYGPLDHVFTGVYQGYMEVFRICRETGVKLHIAHLSTAFHIPQPHPGYLEKAAARATLEIIDNAKNEGIDVTFDVIVSADSISSEVPIISALAKSLVNMERMEGKDPGKSEDFRGDNPFWMDPAEMKIKVGLLKKQAFRDLLHTVHSRCRLKFGMIHTMADPFWMNCFRIVTCSTPALVGKSLGEIAESWNTHPLDAMIDLVIQDPAVTWCQFVDRRGTEEAISVYIPYKDTIPCTDMIGFKSEITDGEKRSAPAIAYGLYPHYLGYYVREKSVTSLEAAIRQATSLPAQRFGIRDRGVLKPQAYADILLFNPKTIMNRGDFANPAQPPTGINTVMINGKIV